MQASAILYIQTALFKIGLVVIVPDISLLPFQIIHAHAFVSH